MRKEFMEKVLAIQTELKAPKDKFNKFGNPSKRPLTRQRNPLKPDGLKGSRTLTLVGA